MFSHLLATKFHQPPLHPKRVQRAHLIQRLNDGLEAGRQLSLISAPAGFGKTTCANEWVSSLSQRGQAVSWLSLDPADDDPVQFFTYFLAALQRVDERLGADLESSLLQNAGQLPPPDVLAAVLINAISASRTRFLLVLDDFHVIQDRAILQVLEKLVANQPPQMHLVLVTREDPLMALARLRANNQMTEIRAAELRFSGAEADRFLQGMMGLTLSEGDIAALENRTEGWIVGLQLAGLSMQGRADPSRFIASLSGNQRFILSYLTEEVLNRQPEEIQSFLLQTSILDKLCADLCDAVIENGSLLPVLRSPSSQSILETLERSNLFLIPLDDEGRWYRYHHLFADLLRSQQSRIQKDQIARLHQRASRWYEEAHLPGEAIDHALAGADYSNAVRLLEAHAMEILMQGYGKTVEGWMEAVPAEWGLLNPRANLAFGWLHILRGSYARVIPYLEQVETAILKMDPAALETTLLRAESQALRSNLLNVQGKAAESIEQASLALQSTPAPDVYVRGLAYLGLGGGYRLLGDYPKLIEAYQLAVQNSRAGGMVLPEMMAVSAITLAAIQHGQLHFAMEVGSQSIDRLERSGQMLPPISGTVLGVLGIVYFEWNQLEKARDLFLRALHLSELAGHNAGLVYSRVILSRLYQAEGDLPAAARSIQEAADLLQLGVPAWVRPEVAAQQVRIYLAQDNPIAAEAVLHPPASGAELTQPNTLLPSGDLLAIAGLRLDLYRIQQGRLSEEQNRAALATAARLIDGARGSDSQWEQPVGIVLQALLLRARIYSTLGAHDDALEDVVMALELAEPEGYIRTFMDEGEEVRSMIFDFRLKIERSRPGLADYLDRLLAAFPVPAGTTGEQSKIENRKSKMVEALTDRELEVLRLMTEGLKYGEIAERLVITLNTVRYYVKEIYTKLNVNNRTNAIEVARQLDLL